MKRPKVLILSLVLFALLLAGAVWVFRVAANNAATEVKNVAKQVSFASARRFVQGLEFSFDDEQWWKSAVFYEIFVRSFYDSDGDGIGDLNGITEKLDYLNDGNPATTDDLGVTALWLMPIFPSPSYHGYDVTDYYDVNPDYGTLDDLKTLLSEAHKRGIHVILDLVINHTSSEHPWFSAAQEPQNPFHDWYIWADGDPGYLGPWNEQVWHLAANGEYYYGVFWSGMPDLNLQNPEVTTEVEKIAQFWLADVGVDGFRLDAARHLIEDGKKQANTPATVQWLADFAAFDKHLSPSAMIVGEVWDSSYVTTGYIKSNSLDLVFDFDLSSAIINTVASRNAQGLTSNVKNEVSLYQEGGMANFLTNHDMNRIMLQLGKNPDLMKHAATVLLTLPGTPFIYYGEEIGMLGMKPDEQIRTPMQWTSGEYAGFSSVMPWEPLDYSYKVSNVTAESADEDSLLSFYRDLIRVRNSHPALQQGQYYLLSSPEHDIYAALAISDQDIVLVLMNFSKKAATDVELVFDGDLPAGNYFLVEMLGDQNLGGQIVVPEVAGKLNFTISGTIEADGNYVFDLVKQ